MAAMRGALADANVEEFRRAAHSLKSNSANLGAMTLAALAKELEMMGKAGIKGLQPPADHEIKTLFVGNVGGAITEQDLRYAY